MIGAELVAVAVELLSFLVLPLLSLCSMALSCSLRLFFQRGAMVT